MNSKFKQHTVYKNSEGKRVPGVTTITGELGWSKQTLIGWANRMGLDGVDTKKYVDDKADIGTLAHLIITNQLQGIKTNMDDYSKNQIEAALNSVKSFDAWAKEHKIEPLLIEYPMVSDKHNFGGTADIFSCCNGKNELIDLKTGKDIYEEHLVQVGGGYRLLMQEAKYVVDRIRILNIPRANSEKFAEVLIERDEVVYWCEQVFLNCLENYHYHKELRKELKW